MGLRSNRLGPLLEFDTGPRFRGIAFLRSSFLSAIFEEFFWLGFHRVKEAQRGAMTADSLFAASYPPSKDRVIGAL
jgi:hypothetical protein